MLRCLEKSEPHLNVELLDGVLTISIERPKTKNALNQDLYFALKNIFDEANHAPEVRVLILRGSATDFSSGNDMKSLFESPQFPEIGQAGSTPPFLLVKSVARFSKPCIAAVRGVCIGVANILLLHFDMVYAERSAIFQMPFVSLGLALEGGGSLLLVQRAGYHQAAELVLTAQKYNVEKALSAGIINAIVDDAYQYADEQAKHLSALPQGSLKAVKSLMKSNIDEIIKRIDDEAEVVMQRAQSPETFEAVSAFMQKRKPDFSQFE